MPKTLKLISIILFFFGLFPAAFSQTDSTDSIRIVTYYPSPYGTYRELRTKRMAIGDDYIKTGSPPDKYDWQEYATDPMHNIGYDADLVVQGNVGIGTTVPGSILHVTKNASYPEFSAVVFANTGNGSSGVEIRTAAVNTSGGGYPYLDFTRGSTNDNAGGTPDGTARIWNAMDGINKMFFGLNYPDTTRPDQSKVTIQEDGNVGIGTTEPKTTLDVNGLIRTARYSLSAVPAPSVDNKGAIFYNTDDNKMYYSNGSAWQPMSGGGAFGAWVDMTSAASGGATQGPAATDGLVVLYRAYLTSETNEIKCLTDSSNPPVTIRQRFGFNGNVTWPPSGDNLICPVRKGDYWKITYTSYPPGSIYWISLGS